MPKNGPADSIRRCEVRDAVAIHRILEASPEAAVWSQGAIERLVDEQAHLALVSHSGDEVTGFIAGRRVLDEAEILNLAVKPQFRRQGLGRVLLEALLAAFRERAARRVFLEVRESNRGAIVFYEGNGFRCTGRRERYYQEPREAALILTLCLNSTEVVPNNP